MNTEVSLENLDVSLLMWDMRRNLNTDPMPGKKSTIHVAFTDVDPQQKKWWLIVEPTCDVDLCSVDPGYDVDLYVSVDLLTMTQIWMGHKSVRAAIDDQCLKLVGNRDLEEKMQQWLGLSPFAPVVRMQA